MALSLSFFLCLQVGWRRKPTTDLTPHIAHLFPAPQAQDSPHQSPHFVFWGRGPLSPWPHLGPCPLNLSPASPPPPSGWLLSPTFPWTPSPPLSFLCHCSSPSPHPFLPTPSAPPPWALFYSPSPPTDAISGSGQLSNISVGREKPACVVLAFWPRGWGGGVPSAGSRGRVIHTTPGAMESQSHWVMGC